MHRRTQLGRVRVLTAVLLTAWIGGCNSGEDDSESVVEPVPLPDPTPVRYPAALWDQQVEGETEVLVRVNEVGDVDSASVAQTSGYAEFDSAAVAGVRKLRFSPGKRGERRAALWVRIPVRFTRDSMASVGEPEPAAVRQ